MMKKALKVVQRMLNEAFTSSFELWRALQEEDILSKNVMCNYKNYVFTTITGSLELSVNSQLCAREREREKKKERES